LPLSWSGLLTLWTNSYLVATLGDPTLEVVKRHVENLPDT
jgi:REP element-mobilizing transposase RayT